MEGKAKGLREDKIKCVCRGAATCGLCCREKAGLGI